MKEIESFKPEDTYALGRQIGKEAKPGDVYTLIGDHRVGRSDRRNPPRKIQADHHIERP